MMPRAVPCLCLRARGPVCVFVQFVEPSQALPHFIQLAAGVARTMRDGRRCMRRLMLFRFRGHELTSLARLLVQSVHSPRPLRGMRRAAQLESVEDEIGGAASRHQLAKFVLYRQRH